MKVEAGVEDKLREFLRSFQTETGEYKYRKQLAQVAVEEKQSITVDFEDLISFDPALSREVTAKPDEYLEYANRAAWAQMKIEDPEYAEQAKKTFVRFRRIPDKTQLREIGSEHVGTLIIMDGIIVRSTQVKPLITRVGISMSQMPQSNQLRSDWRAHEESNLLSLLQEQTSRFR